MSNVDAVVGHDSDQTLIEIRGVTKRFSARRGGGLSGWLHRRGGTGQDDGAGAADVDDDDDMGDVDDDELDSLEPLDEEKPPPEPTRDVWALRDVWLNVEKGMALGVIGPNGCGKTTLVRVLTRLSPPTAGTVILRGRVAPMVPTLPGLMTPGHSIKRNVVQVAQFYGIPKKEAEERVGPIAELAELTTSMNVPMSRLSRGEIQRFAFATAMELKPDVLIADELIAVGDRHFQRKCIAYLQERIDSGLSIVFASHQLNLVQELCDEAVLMEDGRMVQRGPAAQIVAAYEQPVTRVEALDRPLEQAQGATTSGVIRGASLFHPTGRAAPSLHATEPGLIEITLDVEEADLTIRCSVALRGSDVAHRAVQPEPFTATEPGVYVVNAYMAPGALDDGFYRADVAVTGFTAGGRRPLGVVKDAFAFEMFSLGEESGQPQRERSDGKRSLPLTWSVAKLPT